MNPWFQLFAVLLLYGILFYIWYAVKTKRGLGVWLQKTKPQTEIRLIESQGIAPRTSAILIEVRNQPILVVQAPQGIQVVPLPQNTSRPSEKTS